MNEILILGAGYTGMAAITGLAGRLKGRDDVHITLVNPQPRFTERLSTMPTHCATTPWSTRWAVSPTPRRSLASTNSPTPSMARTTRRFLPNTWTDLPTAPSWSPGSMTGASVKKREATERFFAAVTGGDINELMELLALEVTPWTDGGGKVRHAMRPIIGAANVARWIAGTIKRPYERVEIADMAAEIVDINGEPGIVMSGGGRVIATLTVDLDADGRIVAVRNVANPDKLHAVADGVKRI
jgi:hypothetical protein